MSKIILKWLMLLPCLLFTSCQNNKINDIEYPDYVGYSNITSSFLYDYVVAIDTIKNNLDFIKDLSFTKTNEEDYLILGSIGFIYNGEGYKNYHLGDNDKLCFNENEVLYSSTLGNYSSNEIIDFLVNNGKRISV